MSPMVVTFLPIESEEKPQSYKVIKQYGHKKTTQQVHPTLVEQAVSLTAP